MRPRCTAGVATALEARAHELADIQPGRIAYHYLRGAGARDRPHRGRMGLLWCGRRRHQDGSARPRQAVQLLTEAVDVPRPTRRRCPSRPRRPRLPAAARSRRGARPRRPVRGGAMPATWRPPRQPATTARPTSSPVRHLGYSAAGSLLPLVPRSNGAYALEETLEQLGETQGQLRALVLAPGAAAPLRDALRRAPGAVGRGGLAGPPVRRSDRAGQDAGGPLPRAEGPDNIEESLTVGAEVGALGEQTGDPDLRLQGILVRIAVSWRRDGMTRPAGSRTRSR